MTLVFHDPSSRPHPRHRCATGRRRALARTTLGATLALSACSTSPGSPAPSDTYTLGDLQRDVDAISELGVTGVLARVVTPAGELVAVSGVRDLTSGDPVDPDGYFRIASATKPFTASVILQLVGEGELTLGDSVDQHLPEVEWGSGNDGSRITVRDLLQHTSGIQDDYPEIGSVEDFEQHRYDLITPEETVANAMQQEPFFQPGEGWAYSNTGYVLLGMIIEHVTGRTWHEEVHLRISQALGLAGISWPGTSASLPDPHARSYEPLPPDFELVDVTEQTGSHNGGAGGGLIGTTRDLGQFLRALLDGTLLPPEELAALQETVPVSPEMELFLPGARSGLGVFSRPLSCGGLYFGHDGGDGGYITHDGVTPDGQRSVVVSMTTALSDSLDGILEQSAAAARLVDAALCGAR